MEHSEFLYGAIAIFSSLTFATIVHAICRYLKISFSVGLLFGGILLALFVEYFHISVFEYFQFSPEVVFYIFLPTLIFESAYNLNFRQLKGIIGDVVLMATFGLFLSMFIVAGLMHYFTGLNWGTAFLFGALISATDPVAVLAIFKELRAPKKLSTMMDGESLLNDGTGLIVFNFVMKVVIVGTVTFNSQSFLSEGGYFITSLVKGIGIGLVLGWGFTYAIARSESKGVQLTLSLILAHATFIFAEGILHVSGILTTMAAGLVVGNFGMRKLTSETRNLFAETWEFMGFVANSLIFLLLGMKFVQVDFVSYWKLVLISAGVVIFIARPVSVFISFFISNIFRNKFSKISFRHQEVVFWGGLRGAIAATAVLLIPESFQYFPELLAMTAGTILATFILNATTIPLLLKKLKFVEFTVSEKIQKFEAEILIDEKVKEFLHQIREQDYIAEDIFKELEDKYSNAEVRAINKLKKIQKKLKKKSSREIEKILTYHTLEIEKKCYQDLLEQDEISEARFCTLNESILRQMDRLDRDELPDERKSPVKYAPEIPKKVDWINRIPEGFLRNLAIYLFKKNQKRKILERLRHYRARRIAGAKVNADLEKLAEHHAIFGEKEILEKILKRYECWHKNAQNKVERLEKKFPNIVIPERIRTAQRSCLTKEYECQKDFYEKGLISEKVFRDLEKDVCDRKLKMGKCKIW